MVDENARPSTGVVLPGCTPDSREADVATGMEATDFVSHSR